MKVRAIVCFWRFSVSSVISAPSAVNAVPQRPRRLPLSSAYRSATPAAATISSR